MRSTLLDSFRITAIVLLLVAHIAQIIGSPLGNFFGVQNFYYVSLGGVAVTIFLFVSGLALELNHGKKEISYKRFVAQRFLRIYPVYYMSLIVGIIVFILAKSSWTFYPIFDILLSLSGLYAIVGGWGGPFVGTSWFIGVIMILYFFYPLISKIMKKHPHITISGMFVISVISRIIIGNFNTLLNRPLDWFPPCRFFEFSLGIYLVVVLSPEAWYRFNLPKKLSSFIKFLSDISFPLFLVHYPLLILITSFLNLGIYLSISIILFLSISILISWLFLILDNKIPRDWIMEKIRRILVPKSNYPKNNF